MVKDSKEHELPPGFTPVYGTSSNTSTTAGASGAITSGTSAA
jgi:hypothetical protein